MTDVTPHPFLREAAHVALAALGGVIGAQMRREARSLRTALIGGVGAGFVGFLVAKLCHATGVGDDMTYVFVGVSGWLGAARTIDAIERLLEGRLSLQVRPLGIDPTSPKVAPPAAQDAPAVD